MIIDCFMFFNEFDILEGRLEYLYDTVDYFVIVENDLTHNGNPKPMNYAANLSRYRKYAKKILYYPMSTDPKKHNWKVRASTSYNYSPAMAMDNDQRNHIIKALKLFKPDDIVMISDLDEIPSKAAIKLAIANITPAQPALVLIQDMFYYNLKQKQVNPWPGTIITKNKNILEKTPQWFRSNRWSLPRVIDGGWHISYWGSIEKIYNKIVNFAHQELNTDENRDPNHIVKMIIEGKDLYERKDNPFMPVDRSTLQKDLLSVFEKYEPTLITEYFQSVEGWFNAHDAFLYRNVVNNFNGVGHFVEVGSYKGRSSSLMATLIANSGKKIKFDCVDTWEGSIEHKAGGIFEDKDVVNNRMFDVFKNNMKPVEKYYTAIKMTSIEAAKKYDDNSLDFVFIDADHEYNSVREDIAAWLPKIKIGGIISGHDYPYPPCRRAVDEIFAPVNSIGDCWWTYRWA